jgi:hypothetical protein
MNIGYWYGWSFDFIRTHYWTAWIVTGALVVHLAAKLPVLRRALARRHAAADGASDLERRRFLVATGVAAGVLLFTTAGPAGQQGRPIGRGRRQAGRPGLAAGRRRPGRPPGHPDPRRSAVADGRTMGHATRLPIACVEGWSQEARWRGVRLRDLLEEVGARLTRPSGSSPSSAAATPAHC